MFHVSKGLGLAAVLGLGAILAPAAVRAEETAAPKLNVGGVEGAGGSVKGRVKFDGKKAEPKAIDTKADAACAAGHGGTPIYREDYVFGDNDSLQNVFVYVSKGLEGKTFPAPAAAAVIDQKGCQYVPHVQGVVKGQSVQIKNSDTTNHNVNGKPVANPTFNFAEGPGVVETKKFTKAEMAVPLKCDIHPWMSAFVHVMDHPYFAVTQQDGTFEIKGLPAGEYEVSVWHEFDRFAPDQPKQTVKVEDGKAAEVTFTYAPKKKS